MASPEEVPSRELYVLHPVVLSSQTSHPRPHPCPRRPARRPSTEPSVPTAARPRCEPRLRAANAGRALGFLGNSPERPETLSGLGLLKAGKPRAGPEAAAAASRGGGEGPGGSGPRLPRAPPRAAHAEAGQRGHVASGGAKELFLGGGGGCLFTEAPGQEATAGRGARGFSSSRTVAGLPGGKDWAARACALPGPPPPSGAHPQVPE